MNLQLLGGKYMKMTRDYFISIMEKMAEHGAKCYDGGCFTLICIGGGIYQLNLAKVSIQGGLEDILDELENMEIK